MFSLQLATRVKALSIFIVVIAGGPLTAQQLPLPVVDFACQNCQPADALVQLSRQSGINIVFNDRFFRGCPLINVQARQEPLQKIVERISACAHVSFKVIDNQVIFFRKTQKYTLSGYVQDAESGERLIGATLRAMNGKEGGAVSNEFGFFSGRFEEDDLRLRITMVGYQPQILPLTMDADRMLTIRLRADLTLPEVTITPDLPDSLHNRTLGSPGNFQPRDLRSTPMPGGEKDLLRQTALQTGVQTGVDGLGGLHVRGGNADQNLILLDDVPVYNPSHALGLFSIFNPNTISNVRLWKGDFPARYGGRASSVLDVRTREGNLRQFHANGSVGLFAASLTAEGPIIPDKVSVLIGVRGTYFDPWVRFFSKKGNLLTFSGQQANYQFYDFNVKMNYVVSSKDRLYLSYYYGGDKFENPFEQKSAGTEGALTEQYRLQSDWGNMIAALRWNHVLSKNLFTNTTLRYSRFFYESRLSFASSLVTPSGRPLILADYAQFYRTYIGDWSGKTDFTAFTSDRMTLRWGASFTQHNFQPGALSVNFLQPGRSPNSIDSIANVLLNNEHLAAGEAEGYFDVEFKPIPQWRIEAGFNGSIFQANTVHYNALLPRFRLQHDGVKGWSQWFGYHRTTQYLHQIGSFNVSLPFELWVPSTSKVPPEQVMQISAGVGWQHPGWSWQLEGYYKSLDRVLTFLSATDALYTGGAEDASGWEDRIAIGRGSSRGLELLIEKTRGATTGSVGYTLSKATRQFNEVNSGRTFPFRFDRRHDFKISVHQRLFTWLDADVLWTFATGNPITLAGVKYVHRTPGSDLERDVYVYTEVNGYRLPNYHRLDMALNAHFMRGRLEHSIQLGAYNVYNRANPFYLYVNAGSGVKGSAIQFTLLPVLPVFRYEIKW